MPSVAKDRQPPVVYIAGPFRGPDAWAIEQNIRRAEEAAFAVWRAGMIALCPHTNTRFFQGALPDEVWLEGDLELLRRCDAVLLIDGWEDSVGAKLERAEALRCGIPIYCTLSFLVEAHKKNYFTTTRYRDPSRPSRPSCPSSTSEEPH